MSEPTIDEIGVRIRRLRTSRGLSIRDLARMSDLSPSFISQLERGLTRVSIPSLLRITGALGVSTGGLLSDESLVMRPQHQADRRPLTYGDYQEFVLSRRPSAHFEVFLGVLKPGSAEAPEGVSAGNSEEFCYVICGRVRCYVGEDSYLMEAGDAIEYLSSIPARVENAGEETAQVLWVIGPPTIGRDQRGSNKDHKNGRNRGKSGTTRSPASRTPDTADAGGVTT